MDDERLVENFDFAVTVQIPAFKKINYQDRYQQYKDYNEHDQKNIIAYFLLESYNKYVSFDMSHYIDLNFEKHPKCLYNRIHLHTTIKCIPAYKMRAIQAFFCKLLGVKTLKQSCDVFYYEPKYSEGWEYYQQKDDQLDNLEADLLLLEGCEKANKMIVEF